MTDKTLNRRVRAALRKAGETVVTKSNPTRIPGVRTFGQGYMTNWSTTRVERADGTAELVDTVEVRYSYGAWHTDRDATARAMEEAESILNAAGFNLDVTLHDSGEIARLEVLP